MSQARVTLEHVRAARSALSDVVKRTPLDANATFSALCGREIHLKLENLQKTGSFKVRGALNKIRRLSPEARARGVITASAGNHAQGVAYAARMLNVKATVVMPETVAFSKLSATSGYGAHTILAGSEYAAAYEHAKELCAEQGATFVHGFDDPDIIAGQGTLGLEIIEQLSEVDTIVVPVGGGGLLAGILTAVRGLGSKAHVVGVQAEGASSLAESLHKGEICDAERVDTIADGLATRAIGKLPFEIIREQLDAATTVSDAQIAEAVMLLLERAKTVVEGAGAVGLAACLAGCLPQTSRKVAILISGGNIDMNLLDRIINLGLIHEGRLFRFTTRLTDRPGELQRLVGCVVAHRANIHQISHERARPGLPLTQAAVTLALEVRGPEHAAEVKAAVMAAGFAVLEA